MNYNSTLLTTVAECDILLNMANKEKGNLNFRLSSLTRQRDNSSSTFAEIQSEMIELRAKIDALTNTIDGEPDGYEKNKHIAERFGYEYRLSQLVVRSDRFGIVAQLDRVYDINKLENLIAENEAFIAVITTRKNEL